MKSLFLVLQTLFSGILAAFASFVGVILLMRYLGWSGPAVDLRLFGFFFRLWGDWPALLAPLIVTPIAMVSSFRWYRKRMLEEQASKDRK